ncbi:MAG TPA: DUF423 domain-containing protein [Candidatus Sulfotelmatobacter sp.]|nr:DUF423 domain-containing protein [Candidatus Sulfotelmatobacter sp.]
MAQSFLILGAILAAAGVGAGAFGAHALRGRVSAEMLAVFETGVRYHLIHALALVAVGLVATRWSSPAVALAGWLFCAGVVFFSGSLYLLALGAPRIFGVITPVGGAAFIAGWLILAYGVSLGPT